MRLALIDDCKGKVYPIIDYEGPEGNAGIAVQFL